MAVRPTKDVESTVRTLLQQVGEDPSRPGIIETPGRVARAWEHWMQGMKQDPSDILKTFEDGAEEADELVTNGPIAIYSHCEHHMVPFFGTAYIGYIPQKRIIGLSKLTRLCHIFMHRLQVQERLTNDIAQALMKGLEPLGVGVIIKCRHLCMESRGVQTTGTHTVTSKMLGALRLNPSAREEFLEMVKMAGGDVK